MISVRLADGRVEVQEAPRPSRPPGFALLRMLCAGICNTDLELQRGYYGFAGVPGHEFVGEVVEADTTDLIGRRVNIKIEEIARPELQAHLVAEEIAEQLSKRASFRRTMKRAIETTMDSGAKGIKIQLSGRLGGSEMARCEKATAGSLPLSTLRAKIDYGFAEAWTAQGNLGVQVWVNQGMHGVEADGADAQASEAPKKPKRTYKR